jgi:threonine dehydrogenase-like Zn-dependent dehydrogenase
MSRLYWGWYHLPNITPIVQANFVPRSFSQVWSTQRAVHYLESGKVNVQGIVSHTFDIEDFALALQSVRDKTSTKSTIVFK